MGFEDETWWSRLARPSLFAWVENDKPLRLIEQSVAKDDPDPKALAAYGILLRLVQPDSSVREEVWLRFVDGRPVSSVTTQFLEWVCERLEARGKTALLMPWDNAPWHVSREVRSWIREHNRQVKWVGKGRQDHRLPPADQEPLAEPHRAALGSCQAQDRRARPLAQRPGTRRPSLWCLPLRARPSSRYSRKGCLILH